MTRDKSVENFLREFVEVFEEDLKAISREPHGEEGLEKAFVYYRNVLKKIGVPMNKNTAAAALAVLFPLVSIPDDVDPEVFRENVTYSLLSIIYALQKSGENS